VQIAAIVVLGEPASLGAGPALGSFARPKTESLEWLAETPIAALELLGQSALQRMIACLQHAGVQTIALVSKATPAHLSGCGVTKVLVDQSARTWSVVGQVFDEYIKNGLQTILLIRLGPYVEFGFADLLQFHRDKAHPVTRLKDTNEPLDFWMVDVSHFRRAGMRFHESLLMENHGSAAHYDRATYVNHLSSARDVRRLVVDGFGGRHSLRPSGRETKPGVWVDENARLHPRAHVQGPAYIGCGTRVQASASIARFSNVERGCHIDRGTVVADASILANTYLGAWLDVSHAVVCGSEVAHLRHNVTVDIQDDKLIRKTSDWKGGRPLFTGVRDSLDRLRLTARMFNPQRSVVRAARALFLAGRTEGHKTHANEKNNSRRHNAEAPDTNAQPSISA
jgi:hypothetical protein